MLMLLTLMFVLFVPLHSALALPTAEAMTLSWNPYSTPTTIDGFYIYWTPRQSTIECRDHTTYLDTVRYQLPDPNAVTVDISVFLPGKLSELCFAVTVYDAQDRESAYALRKIGGNDYGWTGMIMPTEFEVK